MSAPVISVVGLVHVRDGRLLVVRSRAKGAFYLPGGKLEPGETPVQALHREVLEELGVGAVGVGPARAVPGARVRRGAGHAGGHGLLHR